MNLSTRAESHLTHEQLSNLLIADPTVCELDLELPASETDSDAHVAAHLHECAACSHELQQLRQAIGGFRDASVIYAARQPKHLATARPESFGFGRLSLWAATAAAAVVVAIAVPAGIHRQPQQVATPTIAAHAETPAAPQAHTVESDEALLASIDQDLNASIPTSMAPLDNPTPSATNSTLTVTSVAQTK